MVIPFKIKLENKLTDDEKGNFRIIKQGHREGWHRASAAYSDFIHRHENLHVLYLELGVGTNTPVIIKYPFWQMTLANEKAVYACLNYGEAFCPGEIENRSICIDGDIGAVLGEMKK